MNYQKHYNVLVVRGQNRLIDGYTEKHHIIPKCMGGTDERSNLVILTAEEHYVAHQLLVKMYPGNRNLIFAALAMTGNTKKMSGRKNKVYGWLRRKNSIAQSVANKGVGKGRIQPPDEKARQIAAQTGKSSPKPTLKGKKRSQEIGDKISAAKRENPHKYTDEQREKMSNAAKNRKPRQKKEING